MRVVDLHAHYIPPAVVDALDRGEFPSVSCAKVGHSWRFSFPDMPPSAVPPEAMFDLDDRARWMDEEGIDTQYLSLWTDLFGYSMPTAERVAWCSFVNDQMLALAGDSRYEALGVVPLPDVAAAIAEMERMSGLGSQGIMIGSQLPDMFFDDERLEVFWDSAQRLGAIVMLHPILAGGDERLDHPGLRNSVSRLVETSIALSRLLLGGALIRYPDLKVVVAHGGGAMPGMLARLKRGRDLFTPDAADPLDSFRRLHFDSLVLDPANLCSLVRSVKAERVLLGSDYPFPWAPHPKEVVSASSLSDEEKELILGGSAARLIKRVSIRSGDQVSAPPS